MFDLANRFGTKRKRSMVMDAMPADYSLIADLHDKSFPRGWSTLEIEKLAQQPRCSLLVIRMVGAPSNTIAGFNLYRTAVDEAEILSIAVDPKIRRNGLAERLLRETILRLRSDRVNALFLEVDSTNIAAVHLYEKLGFETVGTRPAYYKKEGETDGTSRATALIMRLDLVSANTAG